MARKPKGSGMFTIGVILSVVAVCTIAFVIISSYFNKPQLQMASPLNAHNIPNSGAYNATPPQNSPSVILIQGGNGGGTGGGADNPFVYENGNNLRNPPAKPFYYPTRGVPQSYKQYGVLIGEERRHMGEQTILPLIGRQTYPGSSRYHYYTSTNGYHPMKLPVVHNKRTCNDSTGCDEIYSGNVVSVNGYDFDFKADIYPSPDLQYIL